MDVELLVMPNGDRLMVHPVSACGPGPCCIHNPSDHPLRSARLRWRSDRALMERVCSHGVGHPDPDGLEYVALVASVDGVDVERAGVHGCDGCCRDV